MSSAFSYVLVHGGAGGVGTFVIQGARQAGARVVTTASAAGAEIARKLGAHVVIDYITTGFRAEVPHADVVIGPSGGEPPSTCSGGAASCSSPPRRAATARRSATKTRDR